MDQRLLLMHQVMLADRPRLHAYDQALASVVREGDVVVDVGAGTLVLSMLALRHGAAHVYAIEADPAMAAVAEQIIRQNDLGDRLTLVQGEARIAKLPQAADVVVSEMMGNLGPEEQMVEVLGAVARRNLREGGTVIPRRLVTHLAAIEFDDEGWGLWRDGPPGLPGYRLDAVQHVVEPHAQLHFFQREPRFLAPPAVLSDDGIGPGSVSSPEREVRLRVRESGCLQAVIGYFAAELADGVTLSNYPSYPGCNWAVWVWPLRHKEVRAGDEIVVGVTVPRGRGRARDAMEWRLDCRITGPGR
ncbi:50S ribosomal protein L11 methyltransferase [Lentzea sp. BCCO 10_0856]|uniref:50S ribosomal protein L11 methyltransferase n=1 Tax=Lentzea miocenica TaxID=3095431 RepID=A0ABU4T7I2_9PSEU|nr:50S ribosomal protein L11 methyltransferase [Lentzea sp. BCCO 10_0856]MDX8034131.1 50S ribosomal protein L11 methyltransferase [Lentzea sp. BCCO 10_0856]